MPKKGKERKELKTEINEASRESRQPSGLHTTVKVRSHHTITPCINCPEESERTADYFDLEPDCRGCLEK